MNVKFKKLFDSVKIGNLDVKNRIVLPPMMTLSASDGMVSEAAINYYAERAKGGAGLIIVEFSKCESQIEPMISTNHLRIDTQRHQEGFVPLTEAVHNNGGKIVLQISPGLGSWIVRKGACPEGFYPVGPTTFASPGNEARPLKTEEVEIIVQRYAEATVRAKNAGFDAVEIHGHSSYLLGQFMSPYINNREDKYGDLWRFPVELLEAAKAMAGADYPIIFRISGDEFIEGGRTIEGSVEICRRMEASGVDAIHVSNGTYYTPESNCVFPYMTRPRATYAPECREIRKAVTVPLILAGRLSDPNDAVSVVEEGTTDFVAIGRGLIADPELVNKIAEGRESEIRPCLSCNYCIGTMMATLCTLHCLVNARVFREKETRIEATAQPKKVVVVGGGPGGMEAARVASLRGHEVILFEEEEELGGQLKEAGKPPQKETLEALRQSFINQLSKLKIDVRLRTRFTADILDVLKPDAVVLGSGLLPGTPPIEGVENRNVLHARDVIRGAGCGENVVVIGAGIVGCETALLLAEQGKRVTLTEIEPEVAAKANMFAKGSLITELNALGVSVYTQTKCEEINEENVVLITSEGERKAVKADTVVLATGGRPNNDLLAPVKEKVAQVVCVGDCLEPRSAKEAIEEGFQAGLAL